MFASVSRRLARSFSPALLSIGIACTAAGALAHEFKAGDLEIKHPWSRATVPAAKVAGGYLTVVNTGSAPDRLLSAACDIAERAELHQMAMKDGVISMRAVEGGIEIPAGGKLALEPGHNGSGYHIMFLRPKRQLVGGEKLPCSLTFEKAGTVAVEFAVEGMGKIDQDHSQHGG